VEMKEFGDSNANLTPKTVNIAQNDDLLKDEGSS